MQDIAGGQCKKFELKYVTCLNAYGIEKGFEKCRDFYDDIFECTYHAKQVSRSTKLINFVIIND